MNIALPPHFDSLTPLTYDATQDEALRSARIQAVRHVPSILHVALAGLTPEQTAQSYRPGGWTIAQVAQHLGDSHLHFYLRIKSALAEPGAAIAAFDENAWAQLPSAPLPQSLHVFECSCTLLCTLLESTQPSEFSKTFLHPQSGPATIDAALNKAVWHAHHHIAQIAEWRSRERI